MKMFFNMQKMLKPFQHLSLLTAGSDPPRYQLNNMQMHSIKGAARKIYFQK